MKNVYAFLFLSMFLLMSVCVPGRAHAQVLAETGTTHFTVRIPVAVSWWTPAGYGIIFAARKKSGNTYFLTVMINTRKQYMIGKYSAGTMTVMQDWKPSPRLKGGYGVQNNIRVTESGGTIFLYFNGSFVESFKDTSAPALSTGAHGYIVTIPPTEAFPSTFVEATFIE